MQIRTPITERMTESKEVADLSARMHALGRFGIGYRVVVEQSLP